MSLRFSRHSVWLIALLGLLGVCAVIGVLAAPHGRTFDWGAATAAGTAYGTLVLALVTWGLVQRTGELVRRTAEDASGTHQLAELAAREQEERIRPLVLLWEDAAWRASGEKRKQGLPFRNAGGGPALNVSVQVHWAAGNCALAPTSLASGERATLPARSLIEDFVETWGRVTYSDLLGRAWETRFLLERGGDGQIQFHLCAYGLSDLLLPPSWRTGWERPNGLARISLPDPTGAPPASA